MNKWIGMGRLTRDPDCTHPNNVSMSRFSIACDRRYKKEGQATADFIDCITFNKLADFVEKYLEKGIKVVVEGELQNNNYTDKNGNKQYRMNILVSNIEFAESKAASDSYRQQEAKNDDSNEKKSRSNNSSTQDNTDDFMNFDDLGDDDIPFA